MSQEDSRVRRIARLAGLKLNDCEIDQFEADLADMVAFVERVEQIRFVDGDDEMVYPSPFRQDEPFSDTAIQAVFGPDRMDEEGFLCVPPVLGEDT